ncbi:hypothetical protein FHW69_003321 [Luteibacter sp. Sphag1AF]|uniref:hypothetical protein n=1 Tax=Luteibacter sp. Sphag1AF TaxID=2587031 RepID=UPI001615D24F|nr:hypothetical protein [Luteibacter sp. Sphag1AF]MBB3228679.1 hypothetical protein [Luteibacter sp. Sphag1AF]
MEIRSNLQPAKVLRNGAILGVVLSLHLALLIGLITGQAQPYVWVPPDANPSEHVLEVRLDLTPPKPAQRQVTPPIHSAPAKHINIAKASPPSPAPAQATAPEAPAQITPDPPSAMATPYGNPALEGTSDNYSGNATPRLPGYDAGSLVKSVTLQPPSSPRDTIRAIVNYTNCSKIEMLRNLPGNERNARILAAYAENGCKK